MSSTGSGRGIGSVPTDPFSNFVANAPLADTPGSSDMLALIQNGLTKKLPVTGLPGLTPVVTVPEHIITSGSSYDALITDYFIGVNKSVGSVTTINLPPTPGAGRPLIIKDMNGDAGLHPITVTNGTIDGDASFVLRFAYQSISLISTGGSAWSVE